MVRTARDWPWSNYRATAGLTVAPVWLETDWILAAIARRESEAQTGYRQFVAEGKSRPTPREDRKNQIYLGSDAFVEEIRRKIDGDQRLSAIHKNRRQPVARPLVWCFEKDKDRGTAIIEAYRRGVYSMRAIGDLAV